MLCDRCGATNVETAAICRNCGISLNKQQDISTTIVFSDQALTGASEDMAELPIDELPTAHVPSVTGPSSFAPIEQLPFTTEFPLEGEQVHAAQELLEEDATLIASPSSLARPGGGRFVLPTRSKGGVSSQSGVNPSSAQPIASAPPEITALARPANASEPSAQSNQNEHPAWPSQSSAPRQPNQYGQALWSDQGVMAPVQLHQDEPLSQAHQHYPNQDQVALSTQAQQSAAPDETVPFSQLGMYSMNAWPDATALQSQAGMNMPAFQAEMYATIQQPGISNPPRQPVEMGLQAPPVGDPWQREGDYQAPPVPERLGNVYPGPFNPPAHYGSANQGGMMPSTGSSMRGEINTLLQPLPRWVLVVGPLVGAALLTGLIFLYADWATGAIVAALVAVTLAILLGIAAGVRITLGMLKETNPHRRSQVVSTALIIGLLLLFSGVGVSQQNTLHMAQGRYLESHQNWASAIAEYQAAGEKPSTAVDVARTYDEWGESQNHQQEYASAVTNFNTVLQNYQGATDAFSRAQRDIVASYLGWADQATQQQNYADATAHYDTLLALSLCATDCKQLAQPKDATAYYHLAEQLLTQHQYVQAVTTYQLLTTRFPQAPEVAQIHAHYAQALLGKGQQEINTACSDAVSSYRLLVRLFADTSQGKQAATALTQPVSVKGHFTQTIPGAPFHPTAYLVRGLFAGIQQDQFPPLLAQAPAAPIHSDGTFAFASVPQGTYELIWSSDNTLHFYYAFSGQHVLYTAQLGPLCTYNYGDINQAIPT